MATELTLSGVAIGLATSQEDESSLILTISLYGNQAREVTQRARDGVNNA